MKWLLVIGIAVLLVLMASSGKIPWVDRNIAVSEETRLSNTANREPSLTRGQAIAQVEQYIQTDCGQASKYLPNVSRFEATFTFNPRTDDHYERGEKEWTVVDPISGGIWRLDETTGVIRKKSVSREQ